LPDPGLHFCIPFFDGLETYPIGILRLQKDHLNTYTVDNQELDALATPQLPHQRELYDQPRLSREP
jgi:hypothetical protein